MRNQTPNRQTGRLVHRDGRLTVRQTTNRRAFIGWHVVLLAGALLCAGMC